MVSGRAPADPRRRPRPGSSTAASSTRRAPTGPRAAAPATTPPRHRDLARIRAVRIALREVADAVAGNAAPSAGRARHRQSGAPRPAGHRARARPGRRQRRPPPRRRPDRRRARAPRRSARRRADRRSPGAHQVVRERYAATGSSTTRHGRAVGAGATWRPAAIGPRRRATARAQARADAERRGRRGASKA